MLKAEQPREEEKTKKQKQSLLQKPSERLQERIWGNENAESEIMDQDCRSQSPQERTKLSMYIWRERLLLLCMEGKKSCE